MKFRTKTWIKTGEYLLIAALLVVIGYQIYSKNISVTKVLVIHSYNTDLAWVGDIDNGINRSLPALNGKVQVRQHYMNVLNHPDCNFFRLAADDARLAIDDWKPQVVILVDDLAQALVGFPNLRWKPGAKIDDVRAGIVSQLTKKRCEQRDANFFGLDRLTPEDLTPIIIFAGVNGDVIRYGYDQAVNVTGIFEHKNYDALAETLNAVNQASSSMATAVQLINDYSATAIAENPRYEGRSWAPLKWLPPKNPTTFEEWKVEVARASANNAMLLIANYQNLIDSEKRLVPGKEVIAWTEKNSKYSAVGAATNFVADGGMMTLAISGIEQGEVSIGMVKHYLETGKLPPQVEARQFLIGLNQSLIRKRELKLPQIYEAFSREIGTYNGVSEVLYQDAANTAKP